MTVWRRVTVLGLRAWDALRSLCAVPRQRLMASPRPTRARRGTGACRPAPALVALSGLSPPRRPHHPMESQRGPPILLRRISCERRSLFGGGWRGPRPWAAPSGHGRCTRSAPHLPPRRGRPHNGRTLRRPVCAARGVLNHARHVTRIRSDSAPRASCRRLSTEHTCSVNPRGRAPRPGRGGSDKAPYRKPRSTHRVAGDRRDRRPGLAAARAWRSTVSLLLTLLFCSLFAAADS